jgi:SprT-like family protein
MVIYELSEYESPENKEPEENCSLNQQKIPSLDDLANASVRDAATGDGEWKFRAISNFLYRWAGIFNTEFFLGELPLPLISFEESRREVLGYFLPRRNEQGHKFNVNLNQKYLGQPEAEVLETLLHELVHLFQHVKGEAGKGNYHNKGFVEKAASVGLQVAVRRGCHIGSPTEPFISLLKRYGVSFEPREITVESPKPKQRRPRLRRWSCDCKSVWCGGDLAATCGKCQQAFELNPTMREEGWTNEE